MSHTVEIFTKIKDLDLLEKSCKSFGLTLNRNKEMFEAEPGMRGECSHTIKIADRESSPEIGLIQDEHDLTYSMEYNPYMFDPIIGLNGERLIQQYSLEGTLEELREKGFMSTSCFRTAEGDIVLTMVQ